MKADNITTNEGSQGNTLVIIILIMALFIRFVYVYKTKEKIPDATVVKITSRVKSEPVVYETAQYLKLVGYKVYLPLYPAITYGDSVVIQGTTKENKIINPKLLDLQKNTNFAYVFREKIINFYSKTLPQPHASLLAGVTLGSKGHIPSEFFEKLKSSGTIHVVVASGMNVTLVGGFLMGLLILFFKRSTAIYLSLIGIWFYALLAGFDPPIIRAAIMGSIAFSAVILGKANFALRALLVSAYLMLFINPAWIGDLGFILSFVATLSLILFTTKTDRLVTFLPRFLRSDVSSTLAAQIGVAPILFATFGRFNPLSIVANALILWTIPIITVLGMVAGLISMVSEPLAGIFLYLTYPLTSWFIFIVNFF